MALLESGENYLETILMLKQQKGSVRSIDVANELGFSKASISRAMSILKQNNYIVIDGSGQIQLTAMGQQKAADVLDRHKTITRFLAEKLGVAPDIAEKDACRIEHIISPETFAGIKKALQEEQKGR